MLALDRAWILDKLDLKLRQRHDTKILGLKPKFFTINLLHSLIGLISKHMQPYYKQKLEIII